MEDDRYLIKEFRETMSKLYPNFSLSAEDEEDLIESVKAATQDIGQQHVLGGPLLDILSVTVRLKIPPPPQGSWRIVGDINICQPADPQRGRNYDVYHPVFKRDADKSQFLNPDAPFLTLDQAAPIFCFFPFVRINIDLMAKRPRSSQVRPIMKDLLPLDHSDYQDDKFDEVQHHNFDTPEADVCIKYITYRAACIAEVNFSLDVPSGQKPRELKVSGRINACWHHKKEDFKPHAEHERHCSCVCLFDSNAIFLTTGNPLQLIRPSLAVPSYATLILEFVLKIEGVNCYHVLDFPAQDIDSLQKEFETSNGFVARCKVEWECEYLYLLDEEEEKREKEEATILTSDQKKTKPFLPEVPKAICFYDNVLDMEFVGKKMIEIFSVYVGANEKNTFYNLNGTIDVKDNLQTHRILEMNDDDVTKKFSHGMTLPLVGPHRCLEKTCFLQVNLRDENGEEFCRGYMGWNAPLFRSPWLNKWLCSVIKGQLGFAAIHYALNTSAVSCAVNVFLAAPSSCESVHVVGSVVSQYDLEYTTTLDKKYYRSYLFGKGDKEGYELLEFRDNRKAVNIPRSRSRSSIKVEHNKYWISVPLSKSVVCVPTENSLVIEVNVSVGCDNINVAPPPVQKLIGAMEFQIGRETWHMIKSEDYQMFIVARWSGQNSRPLEKKTECSSSGGVP